MNKLFLSKAARGLSATALVSTTLAMALVLSACGSSKSSSTANNPSPNSQPTVGGNSTGDGGADSRAQRTCTDQEMADYSTVNRACTNIGIEQMQQCADANGTFAAAHPNVNCVSKDGHTHISVSTGHVQAGPTAPSAPITPQTNDCTSEFMSGYNSTMRACSGNVRAMSTPMLERCEQVANSFLNNHRDESCVDRSNGTTVDAKQAEYTSDRAIYELEMNRQ